MNGYTCIKALVLGGIGYTAGSNIPAEAVLPGRVRALIKQGYISPATADAAPVPTEGAPDEAIAELQQQISQLQTAADAAQAELQQVTDERNALQERLATPEDPAEHAPIIIPITRDGGVLEVPAAPASIVAAMCNLQLTAEESIKAIDTMTDETALILIHALDGRKTVKAAAQARAEALGNDAPPEGSAENGEGQGQGDA